MIDCCIFDLDGVVVDTARYHYLAWAALARELGFEFTPVQGEATKGVSRMASLESLRDVFPPPRGSVSPPKRMRVTCVSFRK